LESEPGHLNTARRGARRLWLAPGATIVVTRRRQRPREPTGRRKTPTQPSPFTAIAFKHLDSFSSLREAKRRSNPGRIFSFYALECFTLVLRRGFAMTSQIAVREESRRCGGKKCEDDSRKRGGSPGGTLFAVSSPAYWKALAGLLPHLWGRLGGGSGGRRRPRRRRDPGQPSFPVWAYRAHTSQPRPAPARHGAAWVPPGRPASSGCVP